MESGAGKHWTEEEVKALLSVWAEKNIRKQLYGTLRNKGIFIYIAKRLQALGVYRDWKQCRAKYKNLKYEYRTVKYAHNSGDSSKTMKFFHDLDAILQYEPATQLTEEDANGRCLATLNQSAAPGTTEGKMSVTLEDKEDTSGNPLLLVSHIRPMERANEGGKHWTVPEVRALIGIWSDISIQQQLEGTVRNKRIFEQIAAKLQKFGIERDWKQCRTKYKNLKHEYKIVRMAQDQGITKNMKFFTELDAILGHNKTEKSQQREFQDEEQATRCTNVKKEEDRTEEDTISTASEEVGGPKAPQSITVSGNHIPLEDAKNHLQIVTVSDTEAGKHWCDNEVKALIHIWSDEKIKQMLERATRNKEIFEEIARRLMQFGIDRDWKQCHTKYKNLKYEYRVLQKKNGNPQRKMRFYEEVDCILRGPTLRTAKWKHELFEGHTKNPRTLSIKRKAHEDGPVSVSLKKTAPEITANRFPQSITERKDSTERFYKQETPYMIQLHQVNLKIFRSMKMFIS
uniref:Myb/SANT-like DNA-binding domain-containing protein n=1 Tax=Ailuropoda melanoleuca TaxID=9646 RepID=G1MPL3_AILME